LSHVCCHCSTITDRFFKLQVSNKHSKLSFFLIFLKRFFSLTFITLRHITVR
jgi:hypothetical protein